MIDLSEMSLAAAVASSCFNLGRLYGLIILRLSAASFLMILSFFVPLVDVLTRPMCGGWRRIIRGDARTVGLVVAVLVFHLPSFALAKRHCEHQVFESRGQIEFLVRLDVVPPRKKKK